MNADPRWPTKVGGIVPGALDTTSPEFRAWCENPRKAVRRPLPGWQLAYTIRGTAAAVSGFCGSTMPVSDDYFLPAGAPVRPEPRPTVGAGPDGGRYLHVDEGYAEFWTACGREGLDVSTMEWWGPSRQDGDDAIGAWLRSAADCKVRAMATAAAAEAANAADEAAWLQATAAWVAALG